MEIGFGAPVSGSWATPEGCAEVAGLAEKLGYHSLWVFQRILAPVDDSGEPVLDPQYLSVQDPLVMLGYLSGLTTSVRLGVAVVNAPFYAPTVLAKALATIDRLSRGRLVVGIGLGWMPEEFEAAGASLRGRGARTEDFLRCLKTVWTDEVVSYRGDHYRVARSRVDPKPLQRPHPPVVLGGIAEAALRRAGRMADGWVSSSRADPSRIAESVAVVRSAAEEAGRDPDSLRIVCRAVAKVRDGERAPLVGSLEQIAGDLGRLAEAGVTEAFVDLNFDPLIGSPDADAAESLRHARRVLEALAPGA